MAKWRKDISEIPIPDGFISRMNSLLGEKETEALADALADPPSVSIRINRRKVENPDEFIKRFEALRPSRVPWCDSGFYLEERPDFIHDPLLHAGAYYVQEAASMVYETVINNILQNDILPDGEKGLRILDLCAAPGGKTTAILNALTGDYTLVANEYDRGRVRILRENLDKWGDPNVIITNSSTEKFAHLKEFFDIIAVDAPCSGEGMMRREPVARSQWSEGLISQCSALQKEILDNALKALMPGGVLIYSTCTFNEKENEENVSWLIENFQLEPLAEPRHFMPHKERCEGLFISIFRKPGSLAHRSLGSQNIIKALTGAGIRIVSGGTEKFVKKGNIDIPSSRQVLAWNYDRTTFPEVELSRDDAVSYLKRNAVSLPEDTPKGFVTVTYLGFPLGLVKNIGARANNLYPAEWRILT